MSKTGPREIILILFSNRILVLIKNIEILQLLKVAVINFYELEFFCQENQKLLVSSEPAKS
jgi:hypothetical protein